MARQERMCGMNTNDGIDGRKQASEMKEERKRREAANDKEYILSSRRQSSDRV